LPNVVGNSGIARKSIMCEVIAWLVLLVTTLAACADPPARVRLQPVDLGVCGKPPRARVTTMRVIAYARDGEHPDAVDLDAGGTVSLADLPVDIEQLGVELSGASGVLAAGKTAPLSFDGLSDGSKVVIAVLPLGGYCKTAQPMAVPRAAPLVAPAGNGALVVGGVDSMGQPNGTAEYYDPSSASFVSVDIPVELGADGFTGAALTALTDGRVLVTGPEHVGLVFDPIAQAFSSPGFGEVRAFHAVAALDATNVIVAGGCQRVTARACDTAVASTFRYPVASIGDVLARKDGPTLGPATQAAARLYDLGTQLDGTRAMVLAAGTTAPGTAERFDPAGAREADEVNGFFAQVAPLPGGALLTAFDPDGASPTGAAGVLPPGGAGVIAIALAPKLGGTRLVAAEDGSVLAIGGDPDPAISGLARYLPTTNVWQIPTPPQGADPAMNPASADDPPGGLQGAGLVRLADGSVLVAGGTIAGAPTAGAWLYRPSLVGPHSGLVLAEADGSAPGVIVPVDPATATRSPNKLTLTAPADGPTARALVGGILATTGAVNAAVEVRAGGVALIAQQVGPGHALVGELVPGTTARLVRLAAGMSKPICEGQAVPAFDPAATTSVGLAVDGQTARLMAAGVTLATCDLTGDPDAGDLGAWGISADGAGAVIDVVTVTVTRSPSGA
jgi:hypothetical protein